MLLTINKKSLILPSQKGKKKNNKKNNKINIELKKERKSKDIKKILRRIKFDFFNRKENTLIQVSIIIRNRP